MRFRLQKPVWLVMACVALVAQVVPQTRGGNCDRGCCAADVSACCAACPAEPAAAPCHCHLDARQDEPLSVPKGRSLDSDRLGRGTLPDSTSVEAPHSLGVSQEYYAASLSVPIRPVRVLCGVWRN